MFRRRVPTCFEGAIQKRFGGGAGKSFHHEGSMGRAMNPFEGEALHNQTNRSVSKVIPGKLFMRHWMAGEQATVSIFNRGISIAVTAGMVLYGTFLYGNGNSQYSAIHMWLYVFMCTFLVLHTHMPQLYAAFMVPYVIALLR